MIRSALRVGLLLSLWAFLSASLTHAQTATGTIAGTVLDSTGATLPGATVTLTNEATGAARTVVTEASGVFIFTTLPPTVYSLKFEMAGFGTVTRTGLTLTAGDRLDVGAVRLQVGQLKETVEVSAEALRVSTGSAEVTATLGTSTLEGLNVKGREIMNVVKLLPGVAQTGGGDIAGGAYGVESPAVGGIRAAYNNITLDGALGNDVQGAAYFSTGVAVDAIGEVKIMTSTYLAEIGPNPGASIKMTTRSGTKEYHGTGYLYKRDNALNATDFFINRQGLKPWPYRVNTVGWTLGGPIFIPHVMNTDRSKLFFFWNTEITRSLLPAGLSSTAAPAVLQYTVPTALERQGDFSQSFDTNGQLIVVKDPLTGKQFPGNKIPANRINSNGQKLLGVYPLPNTTDLALTGGLYNWQFRNTQDVPKLSNTLKIDYMPTNKDQITVRAKTWSSDTKSWTGFFNYGGFPITYYDYWINHNDGQAGWTRVLNSKMVNELNFNFTYMHESSRPDRWIGKDESLTQKTAFRDTYGITLGQLYPEANPYNILPQMSFTGISNPPNFTMQGRTPLYAHDRIGELTDALSVNRGTHAFKFGFYGIYIQTTEGMRANNSQGNFAFNRDSNNPGDTNHPFANALLGNYSSYQEANRKVKAQETNTILEWYAQDQWKATQRLTLTYGARFSYFTWWHLQDDQDGSTLALPNYDPKSTPRQYLPAIVNGVRVGRDPVSGATVPAVAISAFVPGTGNPANGTVTMDDILAGKYPRGWIDHAPLQVSPRFGFGYDVFGNGKTAIRGGIGVGKHVLNNGNVSERMGFNQPVVVNSQQFYGNLDTLLSTKGFAFPSSMYIFNRQQKVPVIYNWSLGVQQLLPGHLIVDVSYVGNTQRHIENSVDFNALPAGARFDPKNLDPTTGKVLTDNLIRKYPEYTTVTYMTNEANSNYNSLQVQANRRFSKLSTSVAYTYSKSWTNEGVDNLYVPRDEWLGGPQSFDQPHVFVANFQWTLPKASSLMPNAVIKAVLDNWDASGIYTLASGFPTAVSVTSTALSDISGATLAARPDVVPGVDPDSGTKTFNQLFNTKAFAMPAKGTFGNAPQYNFRGPGINNVDLSLMKRVPLGAEGKRNFRIKVEAYNLLNHTQFSAVNTAARFDANNNQINSQFGNATNARQARVLQIGLTLVF